MHADGSITTDDALTTCPFSAFLLRAKDPHCHGMPANLSGRLGVPDDPAIFTEIRQRALRG
jgi:hypothetical protein